jgi:aspartate kinase
MLVMKFGGSSVDNAPRLRQLVAITQRALEGTDQLVLVCSAMSGVTDLLIGAVRAASSGDAAGADEMRRRLWTHQRRVASEVLRDEWERESLTTEWADALKTLDRLLRSVAVVGELTPRVLDAVAALGERWITRLVAALLREHRVAAQAIDATELIVTDDHFGAARPLIEQTEEQTRARLLPAMKAGIVPVVTGYIGATVDGVVTTLGRGGGDYSAALIGAALGTDEVWIWTDVDGILTADPKIVPTAQTIRELDYAEALELACFGAEILHPSALGPITARNIPLRIANSLHATHKETLVHARSTPRTEPVRTIISSRDLSLIRIDSREDESGVEAATQALQTLARYGIAVLMFVQSFAERSLTVVVRQADAPYAIRQLEAATRGQGAPATSLQHAVAIVSVIGFGDDQRLLTETLGALNRAGTHILAMARGARTYHTSVVLPEDELPTTVRAIHDAVTGLGASA